MVSASDPIFWMVSHLCRAVSNITHKKPKIKSTERNLLYNEIVISSFFVDIERTINTVIIFLILIG